MLIKILILILLSFHSYLFAAPGSSVLDAKSYVQKKCTQVIAKYFPELENFNIQFKENTTQGYFFAADFIKADVFEESNERRYVIHFYPDVLNWSEDLVEAILVHELTHIVDYSKMDSDELLIFVSKYLVSEKFLSQYEKQTDWSALKRAPALALSQIRLKLLIYKIVGPTEEIRYRKNYITPEEILERIRV